MSFRQFAISFRDFVVYKQPLILAAVASRHVPFRETLFSLRNKFDLLHLVMHNFRI